MKEFIYEIVQGQIGYEFKNPDLLQQAFIRRSYSNEKGGGDNEVLEFIGDKVLDIAIVRFLTEKYGSLTSERKNYDARKELNEYICEYSEGQLTELKANMVKKQSLAKRIDELGFSDFLIMGNGDIQNSISEQESVKEDLFEAILGAVAIDSNWDYEILQSVVEIMLNPDSFLESDSGMNYVRLIHEWEEKKNGAIPLFKYFNFSYSSSWHFPYDGISQHLPLWKNSAELKYCCLLKLSNGLPEFRAFGTSKNEARKEVCRLAHKYLEKKKLLFNIQDEIEKPNKKESINQLEILARRGYFSIPTYVYKEKHNENGNPVWEAECHIAEYKDYYKAESSSKKEAKKKAAYKMLLMILGRKKKSELNA